ncbi:MAG TPA: ABC transporter ATP-binding protein [Polyangiaceae bacterium]|nr:ABC transporter ATP-binding protein [Polyangiaceae bacterium]
MNEPVGATKNGGSQAQHAPGDPAAAHLQVRSLQKKFGETEVLRDVNMSIGRGHIAVIIGGSGAGKTTLLRILIGLERPTSGSVQIGGQDIAQMSDRELNVMRRKFGMVFQYSALLDSMNTLDNVAFPLREHTDLSDKEIRSKVTEKLNSLGLENVEKRFPSELSGGMRKRVALARALMLEPEVIMYDEPTSGLDPVTSRLVDDMIVDTRNKFGVTSVIISHDMVGALQIADEIYLLSKGSIVASGPPNQLIHGDNELLHKFLQSSGVAAIPGAAEKLTKAD